METLSGYDYYRQGGNGGNSNNAIQSRVLNEVGIGTILINRPAPFIHYFDTPRDTCLWHCSFTRYIIDYYFVFLLIDSFGNLVTM